MGLEAIFRRKVKVKHRRNSFTTFERSAQIIIMARLLETMEEPRVIYNICQGLEEFEGVSRALMVYRLTEARNLKLWLDSNSLEIVSK
jgi:hypothetical protein